METVFTLEENKNIRTSKGIGVCAAMSCDWLAKSLKNNGISSRGEMESLFTLAIAHSAFEIGNLKKNYDAFLDRFGLYPIEFVPFTGGVTATKVTTATLRNRRPKLIVVGGGQVRGHAMAIRPLTDGTVEFFDPNHGMFRASDNEFNVTFQGLLAKEYVDLYAFDVAGVLDVGLRK
jgi:hypothetical protein